MEKKKVAIIGFAPSWREAPWGSDEYEFWCLNEFYKLIPEIKEFRADRWFEIHNRDSVSKATEEHQKWLKECPVPLYMWQKYNDLPNSVKFPRDEIIEWLKNKGCSGAGYFTNSISWMLAFGMYEGFEEISVFGVDMANDSEYQGQRPSCEYFIGLAEGMGIKVYIPQASDLLKCTQLYGFESDNKNRVWMKAQAKEMGKRIQQFAQQERQAHDALIQAQIAQAELRGAKSAYQEIRKRTQ